MNKFTVIHVPSDAARVSEVMGTKRKFWFQDNELGSCLFKFSRQNTGEDWAEKIAAELCLAIGLPSAKQEFGIWQDQRGTISPEFLMPNEELVHGNDILNGLVPTYPREKKYNVSEHTLATVLPVFSDLDIQMPLRWTSPPLVKSAVDTFVGYLLLDAWIGNGDRHHENWGVIRTQSADYLAPTYDHASSLGRELLEKDVQKRLQNQTIESYLRKNYSAFYEKAIDHKPLKTIEAFQLAAKSHPLAARAWLIQLSNISSDWITNLLAKIPDSLMSSMARDFASQLLILNQERLLAIQRELP